MAAYRFSIATVITVLGVLAAKSGYASASGLNNIPTVGYSAESDARIPGLLFVQIRGIEGGPANRFRSS